MPHLRRLAAMVVLGCSLFTVFSLTTSGPAGAQDEGPSIVGVLQFEDAAGERQPVPGVTITVVGGASAQTDENGEFAIPVPAPGDYEVEIDVSTLPAGIALRDPTRSTLAKSVDQGPARVLFALVSGDSPVDDGGESRFALRRILQLAADGLKLGLYLAMAAIGISLIFGTTGLTNFAHGDMVTWGMLSTYFFNAYGFAGMFGFMAAWPPPFGAGVNLVIAAIFGMIAGALMGWFLNAFLFRRFRKAGMSLIAQMVASIGLAFLMRYLFVYFFKAPPRTFKDYSAQRAVDLGPIELASKDMVAMALSVVVLVGVGVYLQRTRMGKAMRAVADNPDLASSTGIDVEKVISFVWISGGAMAALGGVFIGLDPFDWDAGSKILLQLFAAVTLGGLGTAYGALVGSIIVGLTINMSPLLIDAEFKNGTALFILILILLVRPQGILGRRERIG